MTDLTGRDSVKRIALLGVPVEFGASQRGALMGPAALRTAGLGPLLENLGFTVEDHGDISALDLVRADDSPPLVMELLHDSGLVRSADIVELNPFLDERGRTARVAVELVGSLFGEQITDRPAPTNAIIVR